MMGHLQDRQGARVYAVRHVLFLVRLSVASEQDACRAVGEQDGHGVVVDLGEEPTLGVRRWTDDVRDDPNAPSPIPVGDAASKPPPSGVTRSGPSSGSSDPPARMAPLTSRDLSGKAST